MRSEISQEPIGMDRAFTEWARRPADQRFETLEALHVMTSARRGRSRQFDVETQALMAAPIDDPEGKGLKVRFAARGEDFFPTHWGFRQFASYAKGHASYLRMLPAKLAAECINYGLQRLASNEDVKLLITDRDDSGDVSMLASTTSPTYGRIWDADVVEAVQEIKERTGNIFFNPREWGGKPSGLYASDHDVFMFLIDGGSIVPEEGAQGVITRVIDGGSERDQLHRGFFAWNSETMASELGCQTFLHRGTCGNHTVWQPEQVKALRIRHTSRAPDRFVRDMIPKLTEYANQSVSAYEDMIFAAKKYKTPEDPEEAEKFLAKAGFSRAESKRAVAAANREEGAIGNLWLLHCGLTASARDMAHVDARVELEMKAGKLLDLAVREAA